MPVVMMVPMPVVMMVPMLVVRMVVVRVVMVVTGWMAVAVRHALFSLRKVNICAVFPLRPSREKNEWVTQRRKECTERRRLPV
jgi:hypothetical protein